MQDVLISIITPNYNCERFIAQTIESVLAQTYKNWEMLIVDDCSTDGSYERALEYATKDSRIKVYRIERNSGAAVCRNKAIELSQGNYLAFLDSDDLWLPEKLEKQLQFMIANECDFSFTEYEHINEKGELLGVKARVIKKLTYRKMLSHCYPGCLTVMYRQDLANKIYANDIKRNNDYALFLRVLKYSENAMGMKESLAQYRIRKKSISSNKFYMLKPYITILHDYENLNIILTFVYVFTHIFIRMFFKYKHIKEEQ
jgi:glycosyltransferase involved in cell wall biosynthesis